MPEKEINCIQLQPKRLLRSRVLRHFILVILFQTKAEFEKESKSTLFEVRGVLSTVLQMSLLQCWSMVKMLILEQVDLFYMHHI